MDAYLTSRWLLYLAAFFFQNIKLSWLKNILLGLSILLALQLNPIFSEALEPLLIFLCYFLLTYLQIKNVSSAITHATLPLINLALSQYVVQTEIFQSFSLGSSFLLSVGLLVLLSLAEYRLLRNVSQKLKGFIYLLPLGLFLWLYYLQMLNLFDYLFTGHDTRLEIFKGILAVVMILFVLTIILVQRNEAQVIYQEQLKARTQIDRDYLQLTAQQYQDMRKFRHDYQNILLSIEGFIRSEAWQELSEYYNQELSTHSANDNQQFERLLLLENANLRQIIYAKLAAAQLNNVKVKLELTEAIMIHHPDQLTLSRMLGIILDNAIEEVASLGKDASVTLAFIKESEVTIILVVNQCRQQLEPLNILKKEGFSSKSDGRGLGLANLATLQLQSDILVNTEIEGGLFKQELIVPVRKDGVGL